MASGGPQPESSIEFSVMDESIASIQGRVIDTILVGNTTVIARAIGTDRQMRRIVYSEVSRIVLNVRCQPSVPDSLHKTC